MSRKFGVKCLLSDSNLAFPCRIFFFFLRIIHLKCTLTAYYNLQVLYKKTLKKYFCISHTINHAIRKRIQAFFQLKLLLTEFSRKKMRLTRFTINSNPKTSSAHLSVQTVPYKTVQNEMGNGPEKQFQVIIDFTSW